MDRNLKGVMRLAMEHSDGTTMPTIDPERAHWLREAIASATVDLTQQLKSDMANLDLLLNTPGSDERTMNDLIDDIISLTEDINLSNDFFKLGGVSLLEKLLFNSPSSLKPGAYELVAAVTQNNIASQEICSQANFTKELISRLPQEKNAPCLKKLLLAISCLVRGYPDGVIEFQSNNGFEAVLDALTEIKSDIGDSDTAVPSVCSKGCFLVYSLLQEVLPSSMDLEKEQRIVSKLLQLVVHLPNTNEHLLAALILIFSNSPSIDEAIGVENLPKATEKRAHQLVPETQRTAFVDWLKTADDKISSTNDPAHAELRSYIGVLRHILGN